MNSSFVEIPLLRGFIAKDCLLTGQELACSRINRLGVRRQHKVKMASHKRKWTRSDKERGINGPACLLHKKHWIWFNVGFWCWDISVRLPFYWQIRAHKDTEGKGGWKRLIWRQESQGGILTGNLSSGSQGTLCEKNSFECLWDLVESPLRPIFRRNWEKFLCESGRSDYRYIWALWAFHVMNWYSEVGGKLELDTERKGIVNAYNIRKRVKKHDIIPKIMSPTHQF